jgi:hypothetical protein
MTTATNSETRHDSLPFYDQNDENVNLIPSCESNYVSTGSFPIHQSEIRESGLGLSNRWVLVTL